MMAGPLPQPAAPPSPARRPSGASSAWPIAMAGAPFANCTTAGAVDQIAALLGGPRPSRAVIATLDTLLAAERDPLLRRKLREADLTLCASRLLVFVSRLLGNGLPERVDSVRLASELVQLATRRHLRLLLVDQTPGAAAAAAHALRAAYPQLALAGAISWRSEDKSVEQDGTRIIAETRPDLILASLAPAAWPDHALGHSSDGPGPVWVHFSRSLRELFSATSNARRAETGWSAGLLSRLRAAVPALARQCLRRSLALAIDAEGASVSGGASGWTHVNAGETLTRHDGVRAAEVWRAVEQQRAHCAVDASRVRRVDATGLAILVQAGARLNRAGRTLVLVRASGALRRALAEAKLDGCFPHVETFAAAHALVPLSAVSATPGVTRSLAWCGDVVAPNVMDVWQTTSDYIRGFAAHGATLVIIDLARLRALDPAGAALMLQVKRWSRETAAAVLFARAPEPVVEFLRRAQLDTLLLEGAQ